MGLIFFSTELYLRTVVWLRIRIRPQSRDRILYTFLYKLVRYGLGTLWRVSGAKIDNRARIQASPGVLVIANHQSLLDIPLVHESIQGDYPLMVTRRLYARGVPLVSYMLRLYGYPLVDPGRFVPGQLDWLSDLAGSTSHPMAIFPEGGRTRDGEVRPFKKAGLKAILKSREWKVYVIVVDGLWKSARFADFAKTVTSIRATVDMAGPFSYDGSKDDADAFISTLHREMCDKLAAMRHESQTAETTS
jgi:1-acyl-sn-glycerol-3-phosphate acyltransferase